MVAAPGIEIVHKDLVGIFAQDGIPRCTVMNIVAKYQVGCRLRAGPGIDLLRFVHVLEYLLSRLVVTEGQQPVDERLPETLGFRARGDDPVAFASIQIEVE